ncbi:MAG TPA: hypothetical protein EYG63_00790 [Gammaproteobacteria bacterium]|nr:hypothetical protein [Gammaproteobacteria bacterium]
MTGVTKSGVVALTLIYLSSCSIIGKLGFGGNDKCAEGACETTRILENRELNKNWHCYGVPGDRSWDCVAEAQPGKIATVIPVTPKQPRPERLMAAADPDITTHPMEETLSAIEQPMKQPIEQSIELTIERPTNSEEGAVVIMGQPDDFYAVQLIALKDEAKVIDYARQNGIEFPLYARIESQETEWYVLLLGIYSDLSSAESSRSQFEGTRVLKVRPWIRKLAPLQDAIRLAQ